MVNGNWLEIENTMNEVHFCERNRQHHCNGAFWTSKLLGSMIAEP
jgi:hypothetical protein